MREPVCPRNSLAGIVRCIHAEVCEAAVVFLADLDDRMAELMSAI